MALQLRRLRTDETLQWHLNDDKAVVKMGHPAFGLDRKIGRLFLNSDARASFGRKGSGMKPLPFVLIEAA
jgi:hypothetical protein